MKRCFHHVSQHGHVVDAEPTILSATSPPICENVEERILVDLVVMFAQTFRAVLVGSCEAIVRLAAQTDESVATPLHIEQTGRSLVVRFARDAARFGDGPRATGHASAHLLGRVFDATLGREPFGTVSEVMLSQFRSHEIIDRIAKVVVELLHAQFGVLLNKKSHVDG